MSSVECWFASVSTEEFTIFSCRSRGRVCRMLSAWVKCEVRS